MVDGAAGLLGIEWIDGRTVKSLLPGGAIEEKSDEEELSESFPANNQNLLNGFGISLGAVGLFYCQRLPHSPV
jgi:hypothetical protein